VNIASSYCVIISAMKKLNRMSWSVIPDGHIIAVIGFTK